MSKPNEQYEGSRQAKFLSWLRFGSEPMDLMLMDKTTGDERADEREPDTVPVRSTTLAEQNERHFAGEIETWLRSRGAKWMNRLYALFSVLICLTVIVVLLQAALAMPRRGVPDAPTNNTVSERYIEKGLVETGAVNIVAGMILDYRAFDTLGESTVLFIAACAVLILLRIDRNPDGTPSDRLIAE